MGFPHILSRLAVSRLHLGASTANVGTSRIIKQTFRTTATRLQDEVSVQKDDDVAIKLRNRMAAQEFNNRRAAYKRQVSVLRKEFAEEVAKQRAADKAEQEALERERTRKRLERQRRKNIRSAQNALRQEQIRKEREQEFQEHLARMEVIRKARDEKYRAARQLIIDELEKVAPLWLTTHDEVEASFTHEAEQLLWSRPGGIFGEPNPCLDSHFWQYETHTWHMDRTYKSQREVLLEKLEEMAYEEANIDKNFWTEDRLEQQKQLEEKARLRAMVQSAGLAELLRKQRLMMEELFTTGKGEVPKPVPAPSNQMLRNSNAHELEGAKLLLENPTQFFVFDESSVIDRSADDANEENTDVSGYHGPSLGSPIALRDHLREGSHQNEVFPHVVGKIIKPDTRTEREKKKQEREERMLAAAQAETQTGDMDIELAAEQQTAEDLEPDLNYDENDWDSDEEIWKQGVDPVAEKDILNTPREHRYSEEDLEWVIKQLDSKANHFEQQFKQEIETLKQRMKSELMGASSIAGGDNESKIYDLQNALLSLSEEKLILLSDLDDQHKDLSEEAFLEKIREIGLTEEQVRSILNREIN